MDGTSTGTPTGSDRNRGYPAAINNTNLTNLTPVRFFFFVNYFMDCTMHRIYCVLILGPTCALY